MQSGKDLSILCRLDEDWQVKEVFHACAAIHRSHKGHPTQ